MTHNDDAALAPHRAKIDELDQRILTLLNERAQVAQAIAQIKRAHDPNAVLYRPERETAVLKKLCEQNQGPLSNSQIDAIFREIMRACLAAEK